MNFELEHIPQRPERPRENGLNMVMDKGLSIRQAENMLDVNKEKIDLLKLGFGTAFVTPNLQEKIKLYQDSGAKVYFGGTLFEAFVIRRDVDGYKRLCDKFGVDTVEVSDGSITLPEERKCELITDFAKSYRVLSEVGSKEEGIFISPGKWISMMNNELAAGSWKVIAEARESGTVGIYRPNGTAHVMLVNKILNKVPKDDILWEAPKKEQQVWFINLVGANVNLGNIAPNDIIPLECLRLGLRGDTFFNYLPEDFKKYAHKNTEQE
ncbi:MAG: phosphosulfolactate synthase [Patiriisocius sp.]